ncbi:hypothetical protein PFICI_07823 [Pestalotiopsis fici W106-1]|uniref:CID domain-containing protein n=1 Tax=Pestalotiopsis fici (strain W106-1 / CGMCC3.15140) TaxID=1229662 RepID=W3X2R4_PESFW|nr:uncharacterized protein PFICI_07823 [Pestalotiopsis fici W106-1]ETS80294.1 hypothetical protein PFICI_07823 [Pestalotiopsis fici W106-1]
MASPQLAIAKVSFSAVLLRPDPVSCSRADIDDFLGQLDATLLRCSPANVQKSKQWILHHVVQSPKRIAALGKYLTALASSFNVDLAASRKAREPSSKRKRLHILFLLSDVLYHVCVKQREGSFSTQLESFLPSLVQSAAAFANCPKHAKKISDLIDLWNEEKYFSSTFIHKLQNTARDAPNSDHGSTQHGDTDSAPAPGTKLSKDVPYVMPAMHGDANVPWYDLPAANWLPVIEPNSTRPMNPSMIKPLQLVPGPADKSLVQAVQSLLADVDRIYAKDSSFGDHPSDDLDMLGQRFVLDGATGHMVGGQTYYGWSRDFCQKMKQRRKKKTNCSEGDDRGRSLSRSASRSISRSLSRPAFKRQRAPDSRSRSRTQSRDRSRRRSFSRDRYRRRSFSRSRSSSVRRPRRYSRSRSRSQDYGPPPNPGPPRDHNKPDYNGHHQNSSNLTPQPPFPAPNFPFGVSPPPPPPNWQGPWPPPPPPQMAGANWMSSMSMPIPPPAHAGWAPAPPPPPPSVSPLDHQQGYNQFQQGHHGSRGDYRGGRGGYRGNRGGW